MVLRLLGLCVVLPNFSAPAGRPFSSVPDTELVLYPLQDKLTSGDKSLDLSAFKAAHLEGDLTIDAATRYDTRASILTLLMSLYL
ncbi:hypothetical protein Tco_0411072 [Tanacetum coccineum]